MSKTVLRYFNDDPAIKYIECVDDDESVTFFHDGTIETLKSIIQLDDEQQQKLIKWLVEHWKIAPLTSHQENQG